MKIGFFGNTNNYPFMLARALSRHGHEIVFYVDSGEPLNRPEFRYPDITLPYPEWVVDVSPFDAWRCVVPNARRRRVISGMNDCDALVLNARGPALMAGLNKPTIVLLTGTDLEVWSNQDEWNRSLDFAMTSGWRKTLKKFGTRRFVPAQRRGIRNSVAFNYFPPGISPRGDRLLEEIGVDSARRMFFMMADVENRPLEPPPVNDRVRVFCATRLTWKRPLPSGFVDLDDKGSDVMIRGLGQFIRRTRTSLDIRLVKKGAHVAETMELVNSEGLSPFVTWLDELSQIQLRDEFRQADIVFEHFGKGSVGMAGLDAMAIGRPLIANARPEIMEPIIGTSSPICHARTPEEVSQWIDRLMDPGERARRGAASHEYVVQFFSPDHAARMCLSRLSAETARVVSRPPTGAAISTHGNTNPSHD